MKTVLPVLTLVTILFSCKGEIKEKPNQKPKTAALEQVERDTFSFDFKSVGSPNPDTKSRLKPKVERLAELENNYQIQQSGESPLNASIVVRGIKRIPNLCQEKQFFEIKNLDQFEQSIVQINYANIKGEKDLGQEDKTDRLFARARVEELIFKSDAMANNLMKFMQQIKRKGRARETIDKSPNSIFVEGNKVYYISLDGGYMEPFHEEIKDKMENKR